MTPNPLAKALVRYFWFSEAIRTTRLIQHITLRPRKDKSAWIAADRRILNYTRQLCDLARRIRPALLSATGGSSIATMRNKKAPKSEKHPCIK